MIDIKWRIRDYHEMVVDMTLDQDHKELSDIICEANKAHDYTELIGQIELSVTGAEFVVANYQGADRAKLQEGIRRVVQSMYNHCPGLKKAVEADGTIDPDYLPT